VRRYAEVFTDISICLAFGWVVASLVAVTLDCAPDVMLGLVAAHVAAMFIALVRGWTIMSRHVAHESELWVAGRRGK